MLSLAAMDICTTRKKEQFEISTARREDREKQDETNRVELALKDLLHRSHTRVSDGNTWKKWRSDQRLTGGCETTRTNREERRDA